MVEQNAQFNTNAGVSQTINTPTDNQLYISVNELRDLYGINATPAQIRFAQGLLENYCKRKTFLVSEYEERFFLLDNRTSTHLTYRPLVSILAAGARLVPGRRHSQHNNYGNYNSYNLPLFILGNSTPAFTKLETNTIEFFPPTGEIFLPVSIYSSVYNEYNVKYLAGYVDIPSGLKIVLIDIINNVCTRGSSDRMINQVGGIRQTFGSSGFISPENKDALEPFVVKVLR